MALTLLSLLTSAANAFTVKDFARYATNSWEFAQRDFVTAYSPCLDAVVVNFKSSGCQMIAQDPERLGPGSIGLVCVAPAVENGYSQNEHVIFYTMKHDVTEFRGWNVFCVDPHITMYVPDIAKKNGAAK